MIYSKMISTESAKRLNETKQDLSTSGPSPPPRSLPLSLPAHRDAISTL